MPRAMVPFVLNAFLLLLTASQSHSLTYNRQYTSVDMALTWSVSLHLQRFFLLLFVRLTPQHN